MRRGIPSEGFCEYLLPVQHPTPSVHEKDPNHLSCGPRRTLDVHQVEDALTIQSQIGWMLWKAHEDEDRLKGWSQRKWTWVFVLILWVEGNWQNYFKINILNGHFPLKNKQTSPAFPGVCVCSPQCAYRTCVRVKGRWCLQWTHVK